MTLDLSGNIYISFASGSTFQIAKLNTNSTIVWSITSDYWVMPTSMKISPDQSFLIFTDGGNGVVKINSNTGAY